MMLTFRSKKPIISAISSTILFSSSVSLASDPPTRDSITVMEQSVTSPSLLMTPNISTIINVLTPENQMATTTGELLRTIPGVEVTDTGRGNGQSIAMRGFDQKGVLILIDHVRANITSGFSGSYFIDPQLLKQVEVIKGGNSAKYGSNAMGGILLFKTVEASDLLKTGENGGIKAHTSGYSLENGYTLGTTAYGQHDNVDGLVSLNYRHHSDLRLSSGGKAPNKDRIVSILTKGKWQINKDMMLKANLRSYRNHAYQPSRPDRQTNSAIPPAYVDRKTSANDYQLHYQYNAQDNTFVDLNATIYHTDLKLSTTSHNKPKEIQKHETNGIRLNNQFVTLTQAKINLGAEHYQQRQKPTGSVSYFPHATLNYTGSWLEADVMPIPSIPITLFTGIRYNQFTAQNSSHHSMSAKTHYWSPNLALTWQPANWLMLYGSYSRSFRHPTMEEWFKEGAHGPRYFNKRLGKWSESDFLPNPTLKPETAKTKEIGFGLQFDHLLTNNDQFEFKMSFFDAQATNFIDNEIIVQINSPTLYKWDVRSTNIPKASIWGIDASVTYHHHAFSLKLGFNETQGKDRRKYEWITNMGPSKLITQLMIPIQSQWHIGWDSIYAARFNKGNGKIGPSGSKNQAGYSVHHLHLSWHPDTIPTLALATGIDNLFNKEYYSPLGNLQTGRSIKFYGQYQW